MVEISIYYSNHSFCQCMHSRCVCIWEHIICLLSCWCVIHFVKIYKGCSCTSKSIAPRATDVKRCCHLALAFHLCWLNHWKDAPCFTFVLQFTAKWLSQNSLKCRENWQQISSNYLLFLTCIRHRRNGSYYWLNNNRLQSRIRSHNTSVSVQIPFWIRQVPAVFILLVPKRADWDRPAGLNRSVLAVIHVLLWYSAMTHVVHYLCCSWTAQQQTSRSLHTSLSF